MLALLKLVVWQDLLSDTTAFLVGWVLCQGLQISRQVAQEIRAACWSRPSVLTYTHTHEVVCDAILCLWNSLAALFSCLDGSLSPPCYSVPIRKPCFLCRGQIFVNNGFFRLGSVEVSKQRDVDSFRCSPYIVAQLVWAHVKGLATYVVPNLYLCISMLVYTIHAVLMPLMVL